MGSWIWSMATCHSFYGCYVYSSWFLALWKRNSFKQGDILVYNGPSGGEGADGHTAMVYDKAATILIYCTGSSNGVVIGNGVYYFGWQDILRGSSAIEIVRWTGQNPWHKPGY